MDRQFEPLREQRLHHHPHLIFCGIARRPRLDFVPALTYKDELLSF
jgi:hypothetical protein